MSNRNETHYVSCIVLRSKNLKMYKNQFVLGGSAFSGVTAAAWFL